MAESSESGGQLAWRLLATLEGGTLVVAASAILAHMARTRVSRRVKVERPESVLISNTSCPLGREISQRLQSYGCTVTDGACSEENRTIDMLIVIGAEPRDSGLDGLAALVSDDVYDNLKTLETLSKRVKAGGTLVWAASAGGGGGADAAVSGSFSNAAAAFDDVLRTQLELTANASQCKSMWIGRCKGIEQTTSTLVAALLPMAISRDQYSRFSVRNLAVKVSSYLWRWLKIVS